MKDINESFQRLIYRMWPKYEKAGVTVIEGGYIFQGKLYSRLEEIDEILSNPTREEMIEKILNK